MEVILPESSGGLLLLGIPTLFFAFALSALLMAASLMQTRGTANSTLITNYPTHEAMALCSGGMIERGATMEAIASWAKMKWQISWWISFLIGAPLNLRRDIRRSRTLGLAAGGTRAGLR